MFLFRATTIALLASSAMISVAYAASVSLNIQVQATGASAPINEVRPEIRGLDFPVAPSTQITFSVLPGQWDNTPTNLAYNWHFVGGSLLGTGTAFTLDTTVQGVLGSALEVDEIATNANGSTTQHSRWVGPISSSAPVAPVAMELSLPPAPGKGVLPTEPIRYRENGHGIFPGCAIPPAAPNTDPAHVWYIDSVNGKTKDAGATGHAGSAFKDASAIFNSVTGYTGGKLFGSVIAPGDTIYVEPGNIANPVGDIISSVATYSTSDRTTKGAVIWTWIVPDPNAATPPILHAVRFQNGAAGFIVNGFGIEQYRENGNHPISAGSGDTHDLVFENMHIDAWLGHSFDSWLPSHYPNTNGSSSGDVTTAAPTFGYHVEDATTTKATSAANATILTMDSIPSLGAYIWSPGYYLPSAVVSSHSTGIPNGTKVVAVNGLTSFTFNGDYVNGLSASSLTQLVLGGVVASVAALPATGTSTTYYIVQPNATAVQTVYTWNGTAWISAGTILPVSSMLVDAVAEMFPADGTVHLAHWMGAAWEDRGVINATIAPCDPIADHKTGCPATTIPGCDPQVTWKNTGSQVLNTGGGCPAGTSPPWNGTTRALNGETVFYTAAMTILPSGYWTHNDFEGASVPQILIQGATDTANSVDPTHPNLLVSAYCISIKGNVIRNGYTGVDMAQVHNSIVIDNKVKWESGDGFDGYTNNRVWWIDNYYSDPTVLRAHQDALQLGSSNGRGESPATTDPFYGNAVVGNEFYAQTDPTNPFPRPMQAINNTEGSFYNTYVADNIVAANNSGGGISIAGHYNVVAHNTAFGLITKIGHQRKGSDVTPVWSMLANNIGNGVSRDSSIPNYCDPVLGDMDTVLGNMSLPFAPGAGAASEYCTINHVSNFNAAAGTYQGLSVWTPATRWWSGGAAPSPFVSYLPLSPAVEPAPGWVMPSPGSGFSCIQNTFPSLGGCGPTVTGSDNRRPNPAFVGTPMLPITLGNPSEIWQLPTTTVVGQTYYAQTTACWSGAVAPFCNSGIYQATKSVTLPSNAIANLTSAYTYLGSTLNPGIIGAGVNLGLQQPISDIDGNAWSNPPTVGAYAQ